MNSGNSKHLILTDYCSTLAFIIHGNKRRSYKNEEFELLNGLYSVSDIYST